MNRLSLLFLALAATTASTAALAQPRDHDGMRGHQPARGHAIHARGFDGGIVRLDADGDGRVSRAELAGHGKSAGRYEKAFDAIDANRDGFIVRTELQAWRTQQQAQRMATVKERAAQRFAAADADRDGKLSKAEVAEKMPRLQQSFAWMDDNRDGFLSPAELHPTRLR